MAVLERPFLTLRGAWAILCLTQSLLSAVTVMLCCGEVTGRYLPALWRAQAVRGILSELEEPANARVVLSASITQTWEDGMFLH